MKNKILCTLLLSFLVASIDISGDARFRPRYDIKKNGDETSTSDMYYLYRARLNLKADIGEGWFFSTKLASNGASNMTQMGNNYPGSYLEGPGNINSSRPSVFFTELYFGYSNEKCGLWVGAFPIKYNPSLDLHFYPDKLVDVPFATYNYSSTTGLAGYKTLLNQKINWFLSVDENITNTQEMLDCCGEIETTKASDMYTYGTETKLSVGPVSLAPRLLISFGGSEQGLGAITYGAELGLPKLAGIASSLSFHQSSNGSDGDDDYYSANHLRFLTSYSLESGKLKFFYDIAKKDSDQVDFVWLSYTHTCFKGEFGTVSISPTLRLQSGTGAGSDDFDDGFTRSKFELTTQIKFR